MKVNVYYTISQKKVVEVDDKFIKVADDDWFEDHLGGESELLLEELDDFLIEQLPEDAEISAVWSGDDKNFIYEN